MKSLIIYFSATGNTEFLCALVAKGIKNRGDTCDVVSVRNTDAKTLSLDGYDIIGWAAPVFDWRPAIILKDFIGSVPQAKEKPAFILATAGGLLGNFYFILARWLRRKGFIPIAHHSMFCEDAWLPLRPATESDKIKKYVWGYGQPKQEWVDDSLKFGEYIAPILEKYNRKELKIPSYRFILTPSYPLSLFYNHWFLTRFFKIDVDLNKCTKCMVCVKQCPTGKMRVESFPNQKGCCIGCYGCVNACPENAVNTYLTRGKVRYRGLDKSKYIF